MLLKWCGTHYATQRSACLVLAPGREHVRLRPRFFRLDPLLRCSRLRLARHAVELLDVAGIIGTDGGLVRLGSGALHRQRIVDSIGHGVPVAGGGAGNGPAGYRVNPPLVIHFVNGVCNSRPIRRDDAGCMIQLQRPGHCGFWATLVGINRLAADDAFIDVGCKDRRAGT